MIRNVYRNTAVASTAESRGVFRRAVSEAKGKIPDFCPGQAERVAVRLHAIRKGGNKKISGGSPYPLFTEGVIK